MITSLDIARPLWTDGDLMEAVRSSTSWRAVMLLLGYSEKSSRSAGTVRAVRRRAVELGLDSSHFRGRRRWSDAQLRQAVAECRSWDEVLTRLGLSAHNGSTQPHVKSHTIRLGLDTAHLNRLSHSGRPPSEGASLLVGREVRLEYLRSAAGTLAATWFALRGCAVSLPVEPADYDLLAGTTDGISRVQVKTTTYKSKDGWVVTVGHHPDTHSKKGQLLAYDPDVIDLFFVVDGDMEMYLIPSRAIAGRVRILLRTYRKYLVGNARGLLGAAPADAVPSATPA